MTEINIRSLSSGVLFLLLIPSHLRTSHSSSIASVVAVAVAVVVILVLFVVGGVSFYLTHSAPISKGLNLM